jgi:small-conductance mechanosensitive channel
MLALALWGVAISVVSLASPPPANGLDDSAVMAFLNQTVAWYRQFPLQQAVAVEPTDVVVVYDNRQTVDQAVQLAFEFARAQADFAVAEESSTQGQQNSNTAASPQYDSLHKLEAQLDQQIQDIQAESDTDKRRLASATGSQRQKLQDQISELDGEIDLDIARRDAVQNMLEFVGETTSGGAGAAGLKAQIEALASSIPPATAHPSSATSGTGNPPAASSSNPTLSELSSAAVRPDTSHLWTLVANLFALSRKVSVINSATGMTDRLIAAGNRIRAPLIDRLKEMSQQGDQLSKQADTANPSQLAQEKKQLNSLAAQFKQFSTVFIPLNKQALLLGLYKKNLGNWRDTVRNEEKTELLDLLVRLGSLAIFLAIVFSGAALWRRAIFRYVHDPRRLHQLLLLRKFVLWLFVAILVVFSFASSFGSLVTFAGLLTAGVAVALQSVILSVVAYFFLIGKYGLRVGDRVRIGDVTGEVVEMGLVRFHLMELGGSAGDTPTGRTIGFSNSIMFQPASGLFKQIPGTSFGWHEITLTLSSDADYGDIRKRLLAAVNAVLEDYRDEIERENRTMNDFAPISEKVLQPTSQPRFTSSGLEILIRFPVTSQHASEIDARVSRTVRQVLDSESKSALTADDSNIKITAAPSPSEAAR